MVALPAAGGAGAILESGMRACTAAHGANAVFKGAILRAGGGDCISACVAFRFRADVGAVTLRFIKDAFVRAYITAFGALILLRFGNEHETAQFGAAFDD